MKIIFLTIALLVSINANSSAPRGLRIAPNAPGVAALISAKHARILGIQEVHGVKQNGAIVVMFMRFLPEEQMVSVKQTIASMVQELNLGNEFGANVAEVAQTHDLSEDEAILVALVERYNKLSKEQLAHIQISIGNLLGDIAKRTDK